MTALDSGWAPYSRRLVSVAAAVALGVACGGREERSGVVHLAVADARMLLVARGEGDARTLYKLTATDEVVEVAPTCTGSGMASGPCPSGWQVNRVWAAGPKFVYVSFASGDTALVRRSDGRALVGRRGDIPGPRSGDRLQVDGAGRVYLLAVDDVVPPLTPRTGVVRLDVTGDRLAATSLTPEEPPGPALSSFVVDRDGNVVYGGSADGHQWYTARTASGTTIELWHQPHMSAVQLAGSPWVGLDGRIYVAKAAAWFPSETPNAVFRLDFTPAVTWTATPATWSEVPGAPLLPFGDEPIVVGDRLFFRDRLVDPDPAVYHSGIVELAWSTFSLRTHDAPPGQLIGGSTSAVWFADRKDPLRPGPPWTSLRRWTPERTAEALGPGTYELAALSVGTDDTVTFTARRIADGASVLARVDAAGRVTILDDDPAATATQLVALDQVPSRR